MLMSVKNENAAGNESVVLERPAAGGVYASLFEKINLNPVSELSALDIWQDAQAISGIVTLAKVPGADAEGNALTNNRDAAYFQIRQEGGWLSATSVQKVSQYALGELGFVTLNKAPESFDLIDGIKQPDNVVKGIL